MTFGIWLMINKIKKKKKELGDNLLLSLVLGAKNFVGAVEYSCKINFLNDDLDGIN